MLDWKEFVALHHKTEILDESTLRVFNTAYDFDENNNVKNWYDDILIKSSEGYQVNSYINNTEILYDSHIETSIREYLGY